MIFTAYSQKPKLSCIGECALSVDVEGTAYLFGPTGEGRPIVEMSRAKITFAGQMGIMMSGMEPRGFNKYGVRQYDYQEWWLAYPTVPEKKRVNDR